MTEHLDVVALVGSLREASYTRALVGALAAIAPPALRIEVVEIGELPLYNADHEAAPPAAWRVFRERVLAADAVLFATPEYNRSIPGCLKNAIDVGSRPWGHSVWAGKPAAVISASPGAMGGFGANHHLRQCLVTLDMPTLQQPEFYLAHVDTMLDGAGLVTEAATRDFCLRFLSAFGAWISRHTNTLEWLEA